MIPESIKTHIITIWDKYISDNKKEHERIGEGLDSIDEKRIVAIGKLKIIIEEFLLNKMEIAEFKTNIDSFNKQNNLWGFTSVKGQMFFNLLLNTCESEEQKQRLCTLLKDCIVEPKDLGDALKKIEKLEKYTESIFSKAPDKRKAPNPGSVCYFLSYFWQIQNRILWPVMYSSMIVSFTDIGLWQNPKTKKEAYEEFFKFNEEIKQILSLHIKRNISNWDAEHAFWNFRTVTAYPKKSTLSTKEEEHVEVPIDNPDSTLKVATFDINTYLIPFIANLVELGNDSEGSSSAKGSKFEKAVCEVFKQLGFAVESLGQGTGREPDLIAIHKEENVAFIVDAKAYAKGYMMSTADERAIEEYISHYCPKLKREGINKIGFLIVSNSFRTDFANYINKITWKTDIKRFSLITSEALLHLLAYKSKDQLPLSEIIETIIGLGITITSQDVIQKFDDI